MLHISHISYTFLLPELINIIVEYLEADILIDDVISMSWSKSVFSHIDVSYIMYIVDKYRAKIDRCSFGLSPCFPIEILDNDKYYYDGDPLYFDNDVNMNPNIPLHILERRLSGYNGCYVWANPSIPIIKWIKEGKTTELECLYSNPTSLQLFGKGVISDAKLAMMPNAGHLLLEILDRIMKYTTSEGYIPYNMTTIFSNIMKNVSLPFDIVFKKYSHIVNLWLITKNANFPLAYVTDPQYVEYNFKDHYRKELLMHNNDIVRLLKLFPLNKTNLKCLMFNPKYFEYCIMQRTKQYLISLT